MAPDQTGLDDEAWQIDERSPIRLEMAKIRLHRAGPFFGEKP